MRGSRMEEFMIKPVYSIDAVKTIEQRIKETLEKGYQRYGLKKRLISVECIEIKALKDRLICNYGVAIIEDNESYRVEIICERKNTLDEKTIAILDKDFRVTWYCCEGHGTLAICPAVKRGELGDVVATDIMTLLKYLHGHGIHGIFLGDPVYHAKAYLVALKHFTEVVHVKEPDKCPCDDALKLYDIIENEVIKP